MINWDKPLVTRDGNKARLLGKLNNKQNLYPYQVAVEFTDGENCFCYTSEGKFYAYGKVEDSLDLFNVAPSTYIPVWNDVYVNGSEFRGISGHSYDSPQKAELARYSAEGIKPNFILEVTADNINVRKL